MLIKKGQPCPIGDAISLSASSREKVLSPAETPSPTDVRFEQLERENERLMGELVAARQSTKNAAEAARLAGRNEARAEFQRDETERVERLERALDDALNLFETKLNATEQLAPTIAAAALEKLLGSSEQYETLIVGAVGNQLRSLRKNTVIRVVLSAADEIDLEQTGWRSDHDVQVSKEILPGHAKIELRLGELELSIPGYWADIHSVLRRLSAGSEAAA